MHPAGVAILVIVLFLLAGGGGWIIFTRLRAQRLGVCSLDAIFFRLPSHQSADAKTLFYFPSQRFGGELIKLTNPSPSSSPHPHSPRISPSASPPRRHTAPLSPHQAELSGGLTTGSAASRTATTALPPAPTSRRDLLLPAVRTAGLAAISTLMMRGIPALGMIPMAVPGVTMKSRSWGWRRGSLEDRLVMGAVRMVGVAIK